MIEVEKIAEVMGLKKSIHSLGDLAKAVERGLPKSALRSCVQWAMPGKPEQKTLLYKIVPQATFKRRKTHLKLDESERTERLARVIATAEHVWNDRDDAQAFFRTPHPELDGKRPIDAAYTELGARRIEELLWKIFYGLPA